MKHLTYVHVRKQGQTQLCLVETLFINDIPHLLFHDEVDPGISRQLPLDPKRFHRHGGHDQTDAHIYETAVDAPRFTHVLDPLFNLPNQQQTQQLTPNS